MLTTPFIFIYPELLVLIAVMVILLIDVYYKRGAFILTLITLTLAFITTLLITPSVAVQLFHGSFIVDHFACSLKLVLYVLLALIFIYSRFYMQARSFYNGEFFVLSLLSMLGMMILISSCNFLTMYLGLELLVLPLYAMIVMVKNESKYPEAAMKYFVIGSLGAGIVLYGISFIYGATGSFAFSSVLTDVLAQNTLELGMLFIIIGMALEFAAVPFHMWLPDVYEGSPTTVTMIIGTLPKIAVFAISYRLLTLAFAHLVNEWGLELKLMALLSLMVGNIVAIAQQNIKRMLAYSTIGHIGFVLLAFFAASEEGYIAGIYYVIVYAFMALAAFAVIIRLSSRGYEADKISDFVGLASREPWLAFIMMLIMFSLAGIPPFLGFYAKFMVLQSLINAEHLYSAGFALIFSVIGTFYYLRIIKVMYFEERKDISSLPVVRGMSPTANVILSINGLLLLLLGLVPGALLAFCTHMLS